MEKYKEITINIKTADLKKLRKKAGLSLRELGRLSGVSFSNINKYENGLIMTQNVWDRLKKVLDKF